MGFKLMSFDYEVDMDKLNTDFIKLGNDIYAIKRVNKLGLDVDKELREFYGSRYDSYINSVNGKVVEDLTKEWTTQIEHIQKFEGKGQVAIPSRLFNKPLGYYNEKLLQIKPILYSPYEVMTSKDYLLNACCSYDEDMFKKWAGTTELLVQIKQTIFLSVLVGYHEKSNVLYTLNCQTFHTHHAIGGNVCTGNHSAKDFFTLSEEALGREMSRVNMFSPASREVKFGKYRWTFPQLINKDTIISARKRGDEQWNIKEQA